MATHGNIWHAIAGQCLHLESPWGIVAACWSARSKTGEIKIRFFGAQKLPWCWHMLTLVHSGILYTQVILLSCCISFSFVLVQAFIRYYHQVISDLSRLQLNTHPVNPMCDMAWPPGLFHPRPKQLQLCPGAVSFLFGNVWPVPVYARCIHIYIWYWYLLFVMDCYGIFLYCICWYLLTSSILHDLGRLEAPNAGAVVEQYGWCWRCWRGPQISKSCSYLLYHSGAFNDALQ